MGDSLPLVSLGTGRSAVALALGRDHTCALLDNGLLKCWGRNDHGQLGLGDTTHRGGSPGDMGDHLPFLNLTNAGTRAVAVAAGYYHTCAVMDVSGGQLKCWGYNANRQLGQGTTTDVFGKVAGHMGDALPYVLLGAGRHVVAAAAGLSHTCASLDNGRVRCFGNNQYGQLGAGDATQGPTSLAQMGDNLPYANLGSDVGTGEAHHNLVVALAAGTEHTCALMDTGSLKCWGRNHVGQLGVGNKQDYGRGTYYTGDRIPYVQLGSNGTAVAVTAGAYHSCALLEDTRAKCWGFNSNGQLGLGDTNHRGDNGNEMGDFLPSSITLNAEEAPSGEIMWRCRRALPSIYTPTYPCSYTSPLTLLPDCSSRHVAVCTRLPMFTNVSM